MSIGAAERCPTCGGTLTYDLNSKACDRCQRLWPLTFVLTDVAAVPIDAGIDGEFLADPNDRILVDGESEPVIVWRMPFSHAEPLANVLEAADEAYGVLSQAMSGGNGGGDPYNADAVRAIREGLKQLARAGVIHKHVSAGEHSWYLPGPA